VNALNIRFRFTGRRVRRTLAASALSVAVIPATGCGIVENLADGLVMMSESYTPRPVPIGVIGSDSTPRRGTGSTTGARDGDWRWDESPTTPDGRNNMRASRRFVPH